MGFKVAYEICRNIVRRLTIISQSALEEETVILFRFEGEGYAKLRYIRDDGILVHRAILRVIGGAARIWLHEMRVFDVCGRESCTKFDGLF